MSALLPLTSLTSYMRTHPVLNAITADMQMWPVLAKTATQYASCSVTAQSVLGLRRVWGCQAFWGVASHGRLRRSWPAAVSD